jgi:hypothetical protein
MSTHARYPVGVAVKDKLYAGVPGGVLNVLGVRATSEVLPHQGQSKANIHKTQHSNSFAATPTLILRWHHPTLMLAGQPNVGTQMQASLPPTQSCRLGQLQAFAPLAHHLDTHRFYLLKAFMADFGEHVYHVAQ